MLSVITGKQRAGKTYYCVKYIILEFLINSKRPIFTNLPINPDYIIRKLANGKPIDYEKYFERLYVFTDFNFRALREFARKNKVFFRWYSGNKEKVYTDSDKLIPLLDDNGKQVYKRVNSHIINAENIKLFWHFIRPNSVIVLDEIYEYFSTVDQYERSSENNDIRKQLLYFSRQHGHLKTDIFLVSHSLMDLDSFIRRGTQYLYEVKNSKYTNIFESKLMRGLKWPIQFFIVFGYEFGEQYASDKWHYSTDPDIFKCYNSFSHSSKLNYFKDDDDHESSDTGVNFWYNFKRFLSQFSVWLSIGFAMSAGAFLAIYWYYATQYKPLIEKQKKQAEMKAVKKENTSSDNKEKDDKNKESKEYKLTLVTSERLVYSDRLTIKKGDLYNGFEVKSISRSFVDLVAPDGKKFRVATDGLRK